ncbi:hypothetical protein VTH06DRAFT_1487 [Thermothelomyces fergusii]
MPIPKDTVATSSSPERTSPAPFDKPAADEREAQADDQLSDVPSDWEEPHPGQRYPIAAEEDGTPGVDANTDNGVGRVGMAAKAYSPYYIRGWTGGGRRFAPPRLRTPSRPRPAKVSKDNLRLSTRPASSNDDSNSAAPASPPAPESPNNTRTVSGPLCFPLLHKRGPVTVSSPTTLAPKTGGRPSPDENNNHNNNNNYNDDDDASSVHLSMTDFSGFLNPGFTTITTSSSDASSFMSIENSAATEKRSPRVQPCSEGEHVEVDPDPYGWEAELEKRVLHQCAAGTVGLGMSHCYRMPALQYRRASGAKRTLLQKVLGGLGPSTGADAGS